MWATSGSWMTCWVMSLAWVTAPGRTSTARVMAETSPPTATVKGASYLTAAGAEAMVGRGPAKRYGGL